MAGLEQLHPPPNRILFSQGLLSMDKVGATAFQMHPLNPLQSGQPRSNLPDSPRRPSLVGRPRLRKAFLMLVLSVPRAAAIIPNPRPALRKATALANDQVSLRVVVLMGVLLACPKVALLL